MGVRIEETKVESVEPAVLSDAGVNEKKGGQDKVLAEYLPQVIPYLAKEKNAVILAHNYQRPEVQGIADFVGDSLELSREAAKTHADIIIFCGVHFMAETAKILSPQKKVLLPDLGAGCSLAESINAAELREWKKEYPDAVVVSYVNTSAAVKAESDYCCTSANAIQIVKSIPEERTILFLPDMFLGAYVMHETKRKNIQVWAGECHVHAGLRPKDLQEMMNKYPEAEMLIHPECGCTSSIFCMADRLNGKIKFFGTGGMLNYVRNSGTQQFIIGTEAGLIHRLQKENPTKEFIPLNEAAFCKYMKLITLEKVFESLIENKYEITVDPDIACKAKRAIDNMINIG